MIVVDASIAVKWFLPEAGSAEAAILLDGREGEVAAPDLLVVEVSATLVRGANMIKSNRKDAVISLAKFKDMIGSEAITLHRLSRDDLHRAAEIAMNLGHPLKDCIYLVLAMALDCPLVTADARFAERARKMYDRITLLAS